MGRVGGWLVVSMAAATLFGCGGPVDQMAYAVTAEGEDQQLVVSLCGTDPSRLAVARQPVSFFTDPEQQGSELDPDRIVFDRSGSDLRGDTQVISLGPVLSGPDAGGLVVYVEFEHSLLFLRWTSSELQALPQQPWPAAPDALAGEGFDSQVTLDTAEVECKR